MRAALTALILSAAGTIIVEDATAQTWCAISNQGATNCGFSTIDLCRAEVSGNGGSCIPQAPVGHRQPTTAGLRSVPRDDLDALQDRINKRNDKLILCRGC